MLRVEQPTGKTESIARQIFFHGGQEFGCVAGNLVKSLGVVAAFEDKSGFGFGQFFENQCGRA